MACHSRLWQQFPELQAQLLDDMHRLQDRLEGCDCQAEAEAFWSQFKFMSYEEWAKQQYISSGLTNEQRLAMEPKNMQKKVRRKVYEMLSKRKEPNLYELLH